MKQMMSLLILLGRTLVQYLGTCHFWYFFSYSVISKFEESAKHIKYLLFFKKNISLMTVPLLSNDSDFYVIDVDFIPLNSLGTAKSI